MKSNITSIPKKVVKRTTSLFLSFSSPSLPTKKITINYYDAEGNKVDSHSLNLVKDNRVITKDALRILIDLHIPQYYKIMPYFAYPEEDITLNNIPDEIMIAVKPSY